MKSRANSWSAAENEILRRFGGSATSTQLEKRLPGRTSKAIIHQRRKLGVKSPAHGCAFSPTAVGGRQLVAKTCTKCGLLLDGKLFRLVDRHRRDSWCRFCRSATEAKRNVGRTFTQDKKWARAAQVVTLENATRHGEPYTEDDFKVMADPTLTQVEKALALGRTYGTVSRMCSKNGYPSRGYTLGSASSSAWFIDNPNASRIAEIAASLHESAALAASPRPKPSGN